jgi:NifB/MoaA-like Fe-S oxidoreductase
MRPHTRAEAGAVIDTVARWQETFRELLGRRLVYAGDEYYLLAGCEFPAYESYEGFAQHENGIGMARAFEHGLLGRGGHDAALQRGGFFQSVDGAPAEGYRADRTDGRSTRAGALPHPSAPIAVVTGEYGAAVIGPLLQRLAVPDVRVVEVRNEFFGGNTAVAGLLTGSDLARELAVQPEGHRYLLPDSCLSGGVFLDGTSPAELPRPVEIIGADGASLRRALRR